MPGRVALPGRHATDVPVEVNLVIDADTLLGNGTEPALLDGVPIPVGTARDLILNRKAPTWLRRLYTRPNSSELVTMDSKRRLFTQGQRKFIALRDQTCHTPWREAPILPRRLHPHWRGDPHYTDHIRPAEHGGTTSLDNANGLCTACNHAKQAPRWKTRPGPGAVIDLTTPTGHHYRSQPPRPPRTKRTQSPLERQLVIHLRAARHGGAAA